MLPAGKHVLSVWSEILPAMEPGALAIDCSTIDVESARKAHAIAKERGCLALDAPVSGGVGGAEGGDADLHGGWQRRGVRPGRADPGADGQARRALRRGRRRAGGQDLQQHDPRHLDDRRLRGLRAGREARAVRPGAVRRGLDLLGPVLVADQLLPGSGPGAGLARPTTTTSRASPPR